MTSIWRAARLLAAKGIPVFPCKPTSKDPLTAHGFKDASDDPAVIERWSRRYPSANLALPTGLRSGSIVLDLDRKQPYADGLQTLSALEQTLGPLPSTLTAATPNHGEHRYFAVRNLSVRSSVGKVEGADAPGFDVRGDGGYVLCAPSVINGRPYVWLNRLPVAELPPRWIEALTTRRKREQQEAPPWAPHSDRDRTVVLAWCTRALQLEARELAATPGGSRNDRLWRAAAALGGLVHARAIDADDVRRALSWACSTWSERDPSKDQDTLTRGLAFGIAHPRVITISRDHVAA